ncbi:hypothetical protein [Maritalea mediterranea]|uniref:TenA family transcriptional regulator n=1 Tax=Maritalea mediterranea TaxID=2909667 RepID=A0ABS9EE22_9HYPH|nr:hypothetical protein [Maritalea mediterranea]MCF4100020.1 hypothetical protein [Maritalea mediterranea]
MRNNRSIGDVSQIAKDFSLSTAPPPANSLFWEMWNQNIVQENAQSTLNLPYLQGINSGLLDPNDYGGYNVADAYYCFNGADDYQAAAAKAPSGSALQAFLNKKLAGYQRYNATFPSTWHVASAADVTPPEITKAYSDFERKVVAQYDPVYAIIVMLPCEYLWAWLASQMNSPSSQNVYGGWITGNNDPSGAYAMGNFLVQYQAANPGVIDQTLANNIYAWANFYEYANFSAATNTQIADPDILGLTPLPDLVSA